MATDDWSLLPGCCERPIIHWVSPLPPLPTDIAHYTRRILPSLAEHADVVLWTSQEEWDTDLQAHAEVRRFDPRAGCPMPMQDLRARRAEHGAIFFNIGNSWIFHQDIYALSRRVPGVVVLHDVVLQEFFRDMVRNGFLEPCIYRSAMGRHYGRDAGGDEVAAIADAVCSTGDLSREILTRFPMFEAAIEHAVAALVHTTPGLEAIAARGLVPAYGLELPFEVGPRVSSQRAGSGPLRLLQFGHIGPNRRLMETLRALHEVRSRIDFQFEICGAVWDATAVRRLVDELDLSSRVTLRGFVPEPELDAAIARAHLVFNLRYPTMGEASGSQLRIWNKAALSVVSQVGWYASLPDDCLIKISVENEHRELVGLLEEMAEDRMRFRARAEAGRTHLERRHGTLRYAAGILEIAGNFRRDAADYLLASAAAPILGERLESPNRNLLRDAFLRSMA